MQRRRDSKKAIHLVDIVWTKHALERQREWEKKLGISRAAVENILANPDQIVPGYRGILVAQARRGGGLVRVPFVELQEGRKVLTIYWTSRLERYLKEE